MSAVQYLNEILILNIYLQPKASRDHIVGLHGQDEIKITVTAPPVDGKANKHLIKYLAKTFKVAKSNICIVRGELSRHKQIKIIDLSEPPKILKDLLNNEN